MKIRLYSLPLVLGTCALLSSSSPAFPKELPAQKESIQWSASGNADPSNDRFSARAKQGEDPGICTISFGKITQPDFTLTGNILLPKNGSLLIHLKSSAQPSSPDARSRASAEERDPYAIRFVRLGEKDQVRMISTRINKRKEVAPYKQSLDHLPIDKPLPLAITAIGNQLEIALGPFREIRQRGEEPLDLQIQLRGEGTQLANLKTQSLTTNGYLPLMDFPEKANISLSSDTAAPFQLKPESVSLTGFSESEGVPFFRSADKAIDVGKSMQGAADPIRKKKAFYDEASLDTLNRIAFKVAGDQYAALHILAFSGGRPDHAPRLTTRMGSYGKSLGILADVVTGVPWLVDGQPAKHALGKLLGEHPVTLADGRKGTLYHLRIPMSQTANVQEFDVFDLEFTRDMHTHVMPPDPNEFGKIPVGEPSDVVMLAATLEPSPVTMTYTTSEPGNIFSENQKAQFQLTLTNRSDRPQSVRAYAIADGPGTGEEYGLTKKQFTSEQKVSLAPQETKKVTLDVTPDKRGWFQCAVGIEVDGQILQQRDTTFAVLAKDTRKAMEDSPFGVWQFWTPHFLEIQPDQIDRLASIMHKGGWRYTYGGVPSLLPSGINDAQLDATYERLKKQYKIFFTIQSLPESYQRDAGWWDAKDFQNKVVPEMKLIKKRADNTFKVMHESRSSTELLRRFSPYFGGKEYAMPEKEKSQLDQQFENVKKYTAAIKATDPSAKIVLFNDYPGVVNEFFKRDFPKEDFDIIGLEGAMFLRSPERQPDWLSLLGMMHETKRSMEKYGYQKPIWTTEALYHPTESGALSLYEQATIAVREAVMALQLGVQRMAAAGGINDSADDYYWSNWGSTGYCYRDPELNPKPSYAAYAWLTQILDQAKPNGKISTPNASLHVVDFIRPDQTHVYVVWTADGVQEVAFDWEDASALRLSDLYGNPVSLDASKHVTASTSPIYIEGGTLRGIASTRPVEISASDEGVLLSDFDDPAQFEEIDKKNAVMENSWETPNLKGSFASAFVTEDGATALKISLLDDEEPHKLFQRYVEFALKKPILLEGRPIELLFRVKGNSGWGRIIFEVTDAKGRVWTSLGNQYDHAVNSADPRGDSFVNFEGWKTMRFPLVGMYPGKDQEIGLPGNYNWWAWPAPEVALVPEKAKKAQEEFEVARKKYDEELKVYQVALAKYQEDLRQEQSKNSGDSKEKPRRLAKPKAPRVPTLKRTDYNGVVPVDYPLTLTKIIVTMRPHILYLDEEIPVKNPVIYIDNLRATGNEIKENNSR